MHRLWVKPTYVWGRGRSLMWLENSDKRGGMYREDRTRDGGPIL